MSLPEAIDAGGVGLAWVLLYTAPAFVLVGEVAATRRVDRRTVLALVVALVGVALVADASSGGSRSSAALVWGLLSGLTYATHYLVTRSPRSGEQVPRYLVAMVAGAVVLAPLVDWADKSASTWLLLLGIGVVSTYLPFLALSTALRRADATRSSLVAMVEPVAATLLGVTLYADPLTAGRVAGGILVLAAAAAASTRRRDRLSAQPSGNLRDGPSPAA